MKDALRRLRFRLTFWYITVFAVILLAFGAALFRAVGQQITIQTDSSLAGDVREVVGAYISGRPDDLAKLKLPGRNIFVFDSSGHAVYPASAPAWVNSLAQTAHVKGNAVGEQDEPNGRTWRAYAQRFTRGSRGEFVAVSMADVVEIDEQYPEIIFAFAAAALAALAAVALGGWLLALQSVKPVEASFAQMRRFMADAAHELRTPVSVLRTRADVALRRPREPAEYESILTAISDEARRLGGIVDNLLTIARADAGEWPIVLEDVSIGDVALDAAAAAGALGAARHIRINVDATEEARVAGDPALMRQLLMILLDNAVKFSPPGSEVTLSVGRRDGKVVVSVLDRGPGIPPEALPHIFERFYRADPAREAGMGAGLGLSIARWIVDAHSGELSIAADGSGTRAVVTLTSA